MKRLGATIVKNAAANVVRGGASAVVALVLPHFLTRSLDVDRYSAWVLMLQIAAYSNYLDFGLQTAVARYVAQAIERGDNTERDGTINTALLMLLGAGTIAMALALVVVWQLPHIFRGVPPEMVGELRGGVLCLSGSAAILLPLSTFTGILVGLHRNEYPALAIGASRLLGALGVLLLLRYTHSLVWLSLSVAAFNVFGGLAQYLICIRLLPTMRFRLSAATRKATSELMRYCTGLTVFAFGMLLVNGLDVTIVGYFSFGSTGYYGIAASAIGFVTGLSSAIFAALMAPMAVLQARQENHRIRDLVITSSRLANYGSLILIVLLALWGKPLLTLWVGAAYASKAYSILEILICAQAIRMTCSAYSIALIATGQQNYGISGAITEGVTNLLVSILGAWLIGPLGVAWGTAIGAICALLWVMFYTMPHAREVPIKIFDFARETLLRPAVCVLPLFLYVALGMLGHFGPTYLAGALVATLILMYLAGGVSAHSFRLRHIIRDANP